MVAPADSAIALSEDSTSALATLAVSPVDSEITLSEGSTSILAASMVSPADSVTAFSVVTLSISTVALSDFIDLTVSADLTALSAEISASDVFVVLTEPMVSTTILLSALPAITLVALLSMMIRAVTGADLASESGLATDSDAEDSDTGDSSALAASIVSLEDSTAVLSADAFVVLTESIVSASISLFALPAITLAALLSMVIRSIIGADLALESDLTADSDTRDSSALVASIVSFADSATVFPEVSLIDLVVSSEDPDIVLSASTVLPASSEIAISADFAFTEPTVTEVVSSPLAVITFAASASSKML